MAFALSAEAEQKLNEILARYPNKMAACIPVLHLCQEANDNWVSDDVIEFVAQRLELGAAHVKGVVTFYTLFNQKRPGKHQLCSGCVTRCPCAPCVAARTSSTIARKAASGVHAGSYQQGRQGHAADR